MRQLQQHQTQLQHIPWTRYHVRSLNGNKVETHFSPMDRMQLMYEQLERNLDLPNMMTLAKKAYLKDFFPIDDDELKELAYIPLEEYALRGDFRRSLIRSRYFYKDDAPSGL